MTDGEIGDVEDPATGIVANERWVVETLLPAARERINDFREESVAAGYFAGLYVDWTRPPTPGVFAYNPRYAEEAEEQATGAQPRPPGAQMGQAERNDRGAHQQLLRLTTRWASVMPYEVRQVGYEAPTVAEAGGPIGLGFSLVLDR